MPLGQGYKNNIKNKNKKKFRRNPIILLFSGILI